MSKVDRLAILGTGNIGSAIANGLAKSAEFDVRRITLTRRKLQLLDEFKARGFVTSDDNLKAVRESDTVIIAVEPQQLDVLLADVQSEIVRDGLTVISVVSGVGIAQIQRTLGREITLVRAMPNTAIAIGESMTCLASPDAAAITTAVKIFDKVGQTLVIDEEQMIAATALGACGIAFFLRAIRSASQGGIEIGFHSAEALTIAAQTAKGAATLLLNMSNHPEYEIDRVTTPRGCTISGLNRMEHEGFSSAMIKGIVTSAEKASVLYAESNE